MIETRSSGTPIISFKIQKGDKDELIELKSPEIVYNPTKEMFIVKGYNTQYGLNDPTSIEVSTDVIKNKFGLETDKEISEKFPSYRPKAAAPKPKGKKMSFPKWKIKNPNGTPADFRKYIAS